MTDRPEGRWLLLIHQIPPKPDYLRVKIRRRLLQVGSVALKNTVYALPHNDHTLEDFQWIAREITDAGGEALLCEAAFVDEGNDQRAEALFRSAREADYERLAEQARGLLEVLPQEFEPPDELSARLKLEAQRLRRQLDAVIAIDFFHVPARLMVEELIMQMERGAQMRDKPGDFPSSSWGLEDLKERTWVTRKGVQVDRIASAWLIQRFIDPQARFRFVANHAYQPTAAEVRFDMFEGEFTHEGDCCTFEVLLNKTGLDDASLWSIAEIVHDIDLKDRKYGREEAAGIALLVAGIVKANRDDEERLTRGAAVFDDLYAYFQSETG